MLNIDKNYHLGDDLDDTYTKLHTVHKFSDVDYNRGLVLILRDYKECLRSHAPYAHEPLEDQIGLYLQILATYHQWPSKKLLIYYEDLIQPHDLWIEQLSKFLTGSIKKAAEFRKNYTQHLEYSKAECRKIHDCRSGGDKVDYHQQDIDTMLWDDRMMDRCPTLLRRYINHYCYC